MSCTVEITIGGFRCDMLHTSGLQPCPKTDPATALTARDRGPLVGVDMRETITYGSGYDQIANADFIPRGEALELLGSTLYAAMLPDGLIKIGWSLNLRKRLYHFGGNKLLAIRLGDRDDEQAVHQSLREHRAHGYEYYNPTPAVMAVVNEWRAALGLPAA